MDETKERGRKAIRADMVVKRHDLNQRQARALHFLFDHDDMHIRDLEARCPNVSRRTLQRDLQKMESLGLIDRRGAARQALYVLKEKEL